MSFFQSIADFFHEGGPTMYITASVGVVGVVITIERAIKLYREYPTDSRMFMSRVKELMLQDRMEDAIQLCQNEKGLLPDVIKSGLERTGVDESLVRQSMESAYLDQVPKITTRIPYLALMANAGMLFGLLGTVLGLIRQFAAVASADAAQKQLLMAKGIAEAMNNTALGLMVALPLLIIHGILSAKATQIIETLERGASQFLDWIGLQNYGQLQSRLSSGIKPARPSKAGNV